MAIHNELYALAATSEPDAAAILLWAANVSRDLLSTLRNLHAEAMQTEQAMAAHSPLALEHAAKAIAAAEDKGFVQPAPLTDREARMLAALKLAEPVCEDAVYDAKLVKEADNEAAAQAAWDAVRAIVAEMEGR